MICMMLAENIIQMMVTAVKTIMLMKKIRIIFRETMIFQYIDMNREVMMIFNKNSGGKNAEKLEVGED